MTLSSCYFCGTAIEEPLSEYPVVPNALSPAPDEQVTVVLCPSCHRKLSTVLDHVVAAADQRQRTLGETSDRTAPSSGEASEGSEDDTRGDAATDAAPSDGAPSIDQDAAVDLLDDDPLAGDADEDVSGIGANDGASPVGTADQSPTAETPDADDAPATGTAADAAGESDGVTVEDPDRGPTESRRDDDTGGTGDGGRSSEDAKPSPAGASEAPSQATYNRVVRLLQNREFPVERDEIATVAMNAYDIPPEDFDAVIQTAVNRGVLEEEGQYLQKPE